ncbi:hypothetical protein E2320_015561, partial [Naja naja]
GGGKGGGGQAEVKSLEEALCLSPATSRALSIFLFVFNDRFARRGAQRDWAGDRGRGGRNPGGFSCCFALILLAFPCLAVELAGFPSPAGLSPGGLEHTTTLSERPWPGRSPLPHLQILDRGRLEEVEREGEEEEEEEEADAEGVARELRLKVCTVRFCSSRDSTTLPKKGALSPAFLPLSLSLSPPPRPDFPPCLSARDDQRYAPEEYRGGEGAGRAEEANPQQALCESGELRGGGGVVGRVQDLARSWFSNANATPRSS